jgi:uncharacterized protein YpuA (DUF1002 family)
MRAPADVTVVIPVFNSGAAALAAIRSVRESLAEALADDSSRA